MNEKHYSLFGVAGAIVPCIFIAVSILLSPWFSWQRNALSDLGHTTRSSVAPVFNFGLLLGGVLILIYATMMYRRTTKYTSTCLGVAAVALQLVAAFNEVYGGLHFIVSVLFFVSIGVFALVYSLEKKSYLGIPVFVIGLVSWGAHGRLYSAGIAVPETISSLACVTLVIYSALQIYLGKELTRQ